MDLLYINDHKIDLKGDTDLKITYQVNNIADLSKRQSTYTNTLKVPRTKHNIAVLDGLSVRGDRSQKPYEPNTCRYIKDGVTLISNGRAVIKSTAQDYSIYIYEGVIDLFKDMENKMMGELLKDFEEFEGSEELKINHVKNIENVVESYEKDLNYCYPVTDYNGKTHVDGRVNIDYLVPSARVKYLWDVIQNKIQKGQPWQFIGKTFRPANNCFNNLWLTYPQPVLAEGESIDVFVTETIRRAFKTSYNKVGTIPRDEMLKSLGYKYWNEFNEAQGVEGKLQDDRWGIKVLKDGNFKLVFTIAGYSLDTYQYREATEKWQPISIKSSYITSPIQILIYVNGILQPYNDILSDTSKQYSKQEVVREITLTKIKTGDIITLAIKPWYGGTEKVSAQLSTSLHSKDSVFVGTTLNLTSINLKINRLYAGKADFNTALKELKVTDLFKEILWQYGLTVYTHPYDRVAYFLTLKERLRQAKVYDFTDYYIDRTNETYQLSSYAQKNRFKHQYNDDKADYNDGFIEIKDINLEDEKTSVESKIYTPEEESNADFAINGNKFPLPVCKIWEKEYSEKDGVKYKPLNKRYYFLRKGQSIEKVNLVSDNLKDYNTIAGKIYLADNTGLKFKEVVKNNYAEMQQILNDARIHTLQLNLPLAMVATYDMQGLYYFKQENQYYFTNKLTYSKNKVTAEMVRVKYDFVHEPDTPFAETLTQLPFFITYECITEDTLDITNFNQNLRVTYTHGNGMEYSAMEWISKESPDTKIKLEAGKLNFGKGELVFTLSGIVDQSGIRTFTIKPFADHIQPLELTYNYLLKKPAVTTHSQLTLSDSVQVLTLADFPITDQTQSPMEYLQFTDLLGLHAQAQLQLAGKQVEPNQEIKAEDIQAGKLIYQIPTSKESVQSILKWQGRTTGECYSNTSDLKLYRGGLIKPQADYYNAVKNTPLVVDGTTYPSLTFNDLVGTGSTPNKTCKPQTKTTDKGGTVQIQENGNFTYTPPKDYTGDDHFTYEATSGSGYQTGDTYIKVIQNVYVKMVTSNHHNDPQGLVCNGMPTIGGFTSVQDYTLKFYSEAAATKPLDVAGLNFGVVVKETTSGTNNNSTYTNSVKIPLGTEYLLYKQLPYDVETVECGDFNNPEWTRITIEILPGAYTIIK